MGADGWQDWPDERYALRVAMVKPGRAIAWHWARDAGRADGHLRRWPVVRDHAPTGKVSGSVRNERPTVIAWSAAHDVTAGRGHTCPAVAGDQDRTGRHSGREHPGPYGAADALTSTCGATLTGAWGADVVE